MDTLTKKQRSLLMAKVRVKDTDIERLLKRITKLFWKVARYRTNAKNLPGSPDIVFPKAKIAIFADGDFWHGRGFKKWRSQIPSFWRVKITSNITRDARQTRELRGMGYEVLRFWGSVIKKRPEYVARKIAKYFKPKKTRG